MSLKQLNNSVVDLSQVDSIGKSQLAEFINHFVISYSRQLNQLSEAVEQRLFRLYERVNICKANLLILERKLDSIPETMTAVVIQGESFSTGTLMNDHQNCVPVDTSNVQTNLVAATFSQQQSIDDDVDDDEITRKKELPNQSTEVTEDTEQQELLRKYRRMMSVGVPQQAVENKMRLDGLDPKLLQMK